MPDSHSIGTVELQYYNMEEDLKLDSGESLKKPTIAYETYGRLDDEKSNVILICHALTGDPHAAGHHKDDTKKDKPGWWDIIIGPGKPLNTDKYFIICSNVIGSCKGSTGPGSINPDTGDYYGLNFPMITVNDMVVAQKKLIDHMKIPHLFAVVGGSMGGMQVLQWTISYPNFVRNAIMIASAAYSTPQQIAFNTVQRQSIVEDPNWNNGKYYDTGKTPEQGLSVARMIGHITYLSNESMYEKFGRRLQDKSKYSYDFSNEFQVESYLDHQGLTFTKNFDANSYLFLTKALDYFDVRIDNSLEEAFKDIKTRMLIMSISSDWLYTHQEMEKIVRALRANNIDVSYSKLNSEYGHDAFLIENGQMNYIINNFLSVPKVKDIMSHDVITLHQSKDIKEAAKLMLSSEKTHIPIVNDDKQMVGLVTAWDLSKAIACNTNNIHDIMTEKIYTCYDTDSVFEANKIMKEHKISGLPVVDKDNKVLGSIATEHISKLFDEE